MASVLIKKRKVPPELLQYFKLKKQDRWCLRNILIWHKPNCMPSSVKDRFTVDYEPIFFWTRSGQRYWFEQQFEDAVRDWANTGGSILNDTEWHKGAHGNNRKRYKPASDTMKRAKRCVWKIPTQSFNEAHFATFPEDLIAPIVKAGCPEKICKKCGVAREKRYEVNYGDKPTFREWRKNNASGKHMGISPTDDTGKGYGVSVSKYYKKIWNSEGSMDKKISHTNCPCNAGWNAGVVLDPFMGAGTTALVAQKLKRNWIGIELNESYIKIAERRIAQQVMI